MSDWKDEINEALLDFEVVSDMAHESTLSRELQVRFLEAPHVPGKLPSNWMAVYGFWWNGEWMKIGKVGPRSGSRFASQHYSVDAAKYTFARSLVSDPAMSEVNWHKDVDPGEWIRSNVNRVDILIPPTKSRELLSLLEVFLHTRLRPRYEGSTYWRGLM